MNTGSILMGRPSLGAWVSYGLGTENRNMPAFVVMPDPGGWPKGGAPAWGNGYLPAAYQGTVVSGGETPIDHLATPPGISATQQRKTLDFIAESNRDHLAERGADSELAARIAAYELAFRMQAHAPEVVDLARETKETQKLYGLDRKETAEFGTRCLLARRMVERGVRFVQLYCGDTNGWDGHSDLEANHGKLALAERQTDRGAADRSQTPRIAEGYAGDLGRRVRPHADERGDDRPRSQPARLLHVDGRRRRQGRHRCRRNRRHRPARREGQNARPRHPRDDPAPARLQPQAAHASGTTAATND